MAWDRLGDWWIEEVGEDPTYETVVTPLLLEVLEPVAGALYLDLGSGEGRVMRAVARVGARVVGVELNESLARVAGLTVVARIPQIPVAAGCVDGVYAVLVVEHLPDLGGFFAETARVTRPGGVLAVVMNHPVWTSPGATPIVDADGEMLWRPGQYFDPGLTEVPSRGVSVTFHHRSTAQLVTRAADHGWSLTRMVESSQTGRPHGLGVPRLLGALWHHRSNQVTAPY